MLEVVFYLFFSKQNWGTFILIEKKELRFLDKPWKRQTYPSQISPAFLGLMTILMNKEKHLSNIIGRNTLESHYGVDEKIGPCKQFESRCSDNSLKRDKLVLKKIGCDLYQGGWHSHHESQPLGLPLMSINYLCFT